MNKLVTVFFALYFGALSFATSQNKTLYILAVDGLSYESYMVAREKGYFQYFKSVSGHIATFPSMTDLTWSEVTHTADVFGDAGRIKSVEAVYFNESTKETTGDVRDYYRRLAQPKYYLSAFQHYFNPYVEALMYFPTQELPKKEIQSVLQGMLTTSGKNVVTGYIGAVDSTAHTQGERLYPVLQMLDEQIKIFISKLNEAGQDFELILISDHGNVGAFQEGELEVKLMPIEIEPVLSGMGMRFTNKLEKKGDVSMPLMALGSWAPVYLKDKAQVQKLVQGLLSQEWFDFAVQLLENSTDKITLRVTGAKGDARIYFHKKTNLFYYEVLQGNPLGLSQELQSSNGSMKTLTAAMIENSSRSGNYPDSIIRLVESVISNQFDFPHAILTFKDGYYLNNSLGKMTTMYRTHGSLSRASSLGIVASSSRALPSYLRARQILPYFGVKPDQLFGDLSANTKKDRRQIIEELKNEKEKGIFTGAREFTDKKIFQMITKFVSLSRSYFVSDEIKSLVSVFNFSENADHGLTVRQFDPSQFDAKNLINPVEIGKLTDIVIKSPDIELLKKNPTVQNLLGNIGVNVNSLQDSTTSSVNTRNQALAAKRTSMKIYQIPYLLDQAFTFQEKPYLAETRDLDFASYWNDNRNKLLRRHDILNNKTDSLWTFWKEKATESVSQRLFKEILKEADIEEKLSPQTLKLVYKNVPSQTTLVYIPGTYNGIFDNEIFSLGLQSLQEDLGLRVLKAPVHSACSSEVNGEILNKFLKADQQMFIDRKEPVPQYIVLGYSKGAVDALYAFIQEKKFTSANIKGLVAIAAPLKGSPVLEKADLPFFLLNLLIDESTPEICKSEKPATSSVSIQGMSSFWRKHEQELVGLTRYFSVSFKAEPEDSHLFMKITKVLGQFDEDNDGIVGLSSTRFPESLLPLDLGILKADHLAGILSSRFNQRAFMRGIARALFEFGTHDQDVLDRWKLQSILKASSILSKNQVKLMADFNRKIVRKVNYSSFNSILTENIDLHYVDPYELNESLVAVYKDPLAFYESPVKLLSNDLGYDSYQTLDLSKMPDILAKKKVTPATLQNFKDGVDLSFNHTDMTYYRIDHQWMYESRSPTGGDNNADWGFQPVQGADKSQWMAMRSKNNSIRLTTMAYRFKPVEFPQLEMVLNVTQGPIGADPVKGYGGKDDSAFQIWLTLRDLRGVTDRTIGEKDNTKVYTFGYYWGEPIPGQSRKEGQIFENYYSNKNIIVATLPPAYQLVLNSDSSNLGKTQRYQRNLVRDLKAAYPQLDIDQLEVLAITLQMDSNDTGTQSEAFMKTLKFSPAIDLGLDAKILVRD